MNSASGRGFSLAFFFSQWWTEKRYPPPPLTESEALPKKIPAFSHYIKDIGWGSKQAAPYISYGPVLH